MTLKLSEWANVAEVLGAVAIVVSLIFVGVQISDGKRETRLADGVLWPIYEIWTESGGYQSRSLEFREFLAAERKQRAVE